jgi:hypothetical protein
LSFGLLSANSIINGRVFGNQRGSRGRISGLQRVGDIEKNRLFSRDEGGHQETGDLLAVQNCKIVAIPFLNDYGCH